MTFHGTPWFDLSMAAAKARRNANGEIRSEERIEAGTRKKLRWKRTPQHHRLSPEKYKEYCETNERHGLDPRKDMMCSPQEKKLRTVLKRRASLNKKSKVTLPTINMPMATE